MRRPVRRAAWRALLAAALPGLAAGPAAAQIQLAPPGPGYPQSGYPQPVYPAPAYPQQGYPPQAYPPQGYPPAYRTPAYPPQAYPPQSYPAPAYPPQGYPPPVYQAPAPPAPAPQAQPQPPGGQGTPPSAAGPAPASPSPSAPAPGAPPSPAPSAPATQAPPAESWAPRTTAELIALNNVTARTTTLTIPVGQTARFGSLTITVRSCLVRPPDLAPDATAWVQIADSREGAPGFAGWMLKEEPYLNAFQSAVYDIRLAGCS